MYLNVEARRWPRREKGLPWCAPAAPRRDRRAPVSRQACDCKPARRPGKAGTSVIYRICSLCSVPKPTTQFSDRQTKVSPNCSRCERCYSALHLHEGLSMAIVRGNIHAHGGPTALLTAWKRRGLAVIDLDACQNSVISKGSHGPAGARGSGAASQRRNGLGDRGYYGGELGPNEHLTSDDALRHLRSLMSKRDEGQEPAAARLNERALAASSAKRRRIDPDSQE